VRRFKCARYVYVGQTKSGLVDMDDSSLGKLIAPSDRETKGGAKVPSYRRTYLGGQSFRREGCLKGKGKRWADRPEGRKCRAKSRPRADFGDDSSGSEGQTSGEGGGRELVLFNKKVKGQETTGKGVCVIDEFHAQREVHENMYSSPVSKAQLRN